MSASFDPVALVEKTYEPQPSPTDWLRAMAAEVMAPFDTEGYGAVAYFLGESGWPEGLVAVGPDGSPCDTEAAKAVMAAGARVTTPEQWERWHAAFTRAGVVSFVEVMGGMSREARDASPVPLADSPGVIVHTADGRAAMFCCFSSAVLTVEPAMRALWKRIAIHLGAGCRLAGRPPDPEADDVEAVLDPGGKLAHAKGEARGAEQRQQLRDAVRRVDRARRRQGRADPLGALELWQGLMAGRWSLVDHFDSDGRRFVLARRNDPTVSAPHALSRRQRQVVFYASLGWSSKEIAYALGLTESTVNAHLGHALDKLGIPSRAELVRIGSQICTAADDDRG